MTCEEMYLNIIKALSPGLVIENRTFYGDDVQAHGFPDGAIVQNCKFIGTLNPNGGISNAHKD